MEPSYRVFPGRLTSGRILTICDCLRTTRLLLALSFSGIFFWGGKAVMERAKS